MERHQDFRDLLQLEADGELSPRDAGRLRQHVGGCADCRQERRQLARLRELLAASRIAVRPDFRSRLMTRLPAAGWESRHPSSWAAGVAALVLLGGGAALLAGAAGASVPAAGALLAVLDLFRSSLLAGAGLLNASWRGVGLALERLFDGSLWNLLAFGVVVLGLDLLFLRLWLASRRSQAASSASPERRQRRG